MRWSPSRTWIRAQFFPHGQRAKPFLTIDVAIETAIKMLMFTPKWWDFTLYQIRTNDTQHKVKKLLIFRSAIDAEPADSTKILKDEVFPESETEIHTTSDTVINPCLPLCYLLHNIHFFVCKGGRGSAEIRRQDLKLCPFVSFTDMTFFYRCYTTSL